MIDGPVSASGRPLRMCDTCLAVDDHPRHVYATSGREGDRVNYTNEQRESAIAAADNDPKKLLALMRDFEDVATQMKHLDCCLNDGCPDSTCNQRLDDPDDPFDGGSTVGAELIKKFDILNGGEK